MDTRGRLMDNIDIAYAHFEESFYYRLPEAIIKNCENSPLFSSLLLISTGYRTTLNKLIGYNVTSHYEEDYLFKYCLSGTGWFEFENKRYVVSAGDIILCNRNTLCRYSTSSEDPWSVYWVYFRFNYMEILYPKLTEKNFQVHHFGLDHSLIRYFMEILQKRSFGYANSYLFYASQTLGQLLAYLHLNQSIENEKGSNKYSAIITHMNNNLDKLISTSQLAQMADVSKDHFIRVFTQCYGYTPLDYFIRLKMQKACNDLLSTELPIKTIATNLGYEDPYYFSRIFKHKIGISPKIYRSNHQ